MGQGPCWGSCHPHRSAPGGIFWGLSSTPAAGGAPAAFPAPRHAEGHSPKRGGSGGGERSGGLPTCTPSCCPARGYFRPSVRRNGARSAEPRGQVLRWSPAGPQIPQQQNPPLAPGGTCEGCTWLAAGVRAAGCRCWTCLEYFPCWRSACATLPPHPPKPRRAGGPTGGSAPLPTTSRCPKSTQQPPILRCWHPQGLPTHPFPCAFPTDTCTEKAGNPFLLMKASCQRAIQIPIHQPPSFGGKAGFLSCVTGDA